MIKQGVDLGLDVSDVIGAVIKSTKSGKQFTASVVKTEWLPNLKSVLVDGNVPKIFNGSPGQLTVFLNEIGTLFSKYKLGIKVNVGGSSIMKNTPGDLDLPLFFTPSVYDDLIKHYQSQYELFKQWAKSSGRSSLYKPVFQRIEKGLNSSKSPAYRKGNNIKKLDVNCIFNWKLNTNGTPDYTFLIDDLVKKKDGVFKTSFFPNLNATDAGKMEGLDLIIFNTSATNKVVNLPPMLTYNL
jgi:hypothetical protein